MFSVCLPNVAALLFCIVGPFFFKSSAQLLGAPPLTIVAILKAASTKGTSGRSVKGEIKKLGSRA
jgi:hypothetical protein